MGFGEVKVEVVGRESGWRFGEVMYLRLRMDGLCTVSLLSSEDKE